MMNYESRPMGSEEVMFPTEKGDWVILKDGTFGNISLQTPDQVLLKTLRSQSLFSNDSVSFFISREFYLMVFCRNYFKGGLSIPKKVLELLPFLKRGCEDKLERNETFEGKIKTLFVEFKAQGQHAFELWGSS